MASDELELREGSRGDLKTAGLEVIELCKVDFSDSTYRITTRTDIGRLVKSIDRIGVLVPPLVKPAGDQLKIISGFLRLDACRQLGIETTRARLAPTDFSDLACAHCAIAENGLQRVLNSLETARAIALLDAAVPAKDQLAIEAAAAGLPDNPGMIDKLLRVVKLPSAVQGRLADDTIGLAMALTLGRETIEFSTICADIFGELRIGLNRQREILLFISEIAVRDGILPLDLITDAAIEEIRADADLDRPLKVRRIRDWLYHRRYPNLAQAEDIFAERRSRLKLGDHIQLNAPRNFESDIYTLSIQFSDLDGIRAMLKRIERISQDPNLKDILSRPDASTGRS